MTKQWVQTIYVSNEYAAKEPKWKEHVIDSLSRTVEKQAHGTPVVLERLIDEREATKSLAPCDTQAPHGMFGVTGIFRVTRMDSPDCGNH